MLRVFSFPSLSHLSLFIVVFLTLLTLDLSKIKFQQSVVKRRLQTWGKMQARGKIQIADHR